MITHILVFSLNCFSWFQSLKITNYFYFKKEIYALVILISVKSGATCLLVVTVVLPMCIKFTNGNLNIELTLRMMKSIGRYWIIWWRISFIIY